MLMLFFALGGPGASGVNMILGQGKRLQKIVDSQTTPLSDQVSSFCQSA